MVTDELVRLEKKDAERAIEVLSKAFFNYPLLTYYFPDKDQRRKNTRKLLTLDVYSGLAFGEVYASSQDFEGVAIWISPGNYPLSFLRMLRSVPLRAVFGLMNNDFQRMQATGHYIDSMHKRLVPYTHAYLQTLGVDPEHQRKGIGGKLVRTMLQRLDAEGMPCFLETLEEKNTRIYRRFGFDVIEESPIPGTELTDWAMLRKAGG